MKDDEADLAALIDDLAREARLREGEDSHPSPAVLTAYFAGELAPAAEDDLQEHLAICIPCSQLLLDLPGFLEPPTADSGSTVAETEASWQELRRKLPAPARAGGLASSSRPFGPAWRRAYPLLAAAVLLALVAAPLWRAARESLSPEPPADVLRLHATEGRRGGTGEASPAPGVVHADAASTILILDLAKEQPDLRFRLDVYAVGPAAAAKQPIMPVPRAEAINRGTVLVVLARRQLAPGRYLIRVADVEKQPAASLGDFPIRVVDP